jgi:ABC-type transport system involved in multi-copper enzyme maturation permease subunit
VARSKQRHPFAGAVRIRARELVRRPAVLGLFMLQATVVAVLDGMLFVDVTAGAAETESFVLRGLRAGVVPGGLLFGVLAAAVVGAEFNWATERALLSRDPRRKRFVAMQLTIVSALMAGWIVVQSVFAIGVGLGLRMFVGPLSTEVADPRALWLAAAGLASATIFYGLLGSACALGFRGALAGVVGVLTYGLLGELVLGPLWRPAGEWTVYSAATSLAGQGDLPLAESLAVLGGSALVVLVASFVVYSGREVRE